MERSRIYCIKQPLCGFSMHSFFALFVSSSCSILFHFLSRPSIVRVPNVALRVSNTYIHIYVYVYFFDAISSTNPLVTFFRNIVIELQCFR